MTYLLTKITCITYSTEHVRVRGSSIHHRILINLIDQPLSVELYVKIIRCVNIQQSQTLS